MSNQHRFRLSIPIYPLVFALYPALALLAGNLGQVRWQAVLRPLLVSLGAALALYLALRLLLKDWTRAALLSTIGLLLFFTYGHIYGLVEGTRIAGVNVGRHSLLVPLWLILFGAAAWWMLRRKNVPTAWGQVLTGFSLVLVIMAVFQIGYSEVRANLRVSAQKALSSSSQQSLAATGESSRPDVYYIILDGYAREDALREDFGYDNTPFLDGLRQLGFVIPECTQSNYSYTVLSLSSSLHMDYLEKFSSLIQQGDIDRDWLTYHDYIMHNPVRQNLQNLGYKTVAFDTSYWFADITDADIYVVANNNPLEKQRQDRDLNDFEDLFVRTTALRVVSEANTTLRQKLMPTVRTVEERRYETVKFSLGQLEQIAEIPGPKFVYAHVVAPHPPYVFDANGKYRITTHTLPGYTDTLTYLNGRVLTIVKNILAQSKQPPIIVIQGDHGWEVSSRLKILNAYYLPDGGAKNLYPGITPVNTFRVIFDTYFGGHYGLVADKSFYSPEESVYQFKPIPPSCVNKQVK